jgi:uncharacterized LabA/DUF88 family protein
LSHVEEVLVPTSNDETRPRVALLVDLDNFIASCSSKGVKVSPSKLMERARTAGNLVWAAVFVDSSTLSAHERSSWFANGFDICDCPKASAKDDQARKDTVDPAIIKKLYSVADLLPVSEVLLASADRDFILAVQHLRNTGKRVRIVVPVPGERISLACYADGALVYKADGSGGSVMCTEAGLSACVLALDKRWEINKSKCGFMSIVQKLQVSPEFRKAGLTDEDARRYLQYMIRQGMVIQMKSAGNVAVGKKGGAVYYNVNRDHPLVWLARKGKDLLVREELLPATPTGPEETSLGEDHPQIRRFRERERKMGAARSNSAAPPSADKDDT